MQTTAAQFTQFSSQANTVTQSYATAKQMLWPTVHKKLPHGATSVPKSTHRACRRCWYARVSFVCRADSMTKHLRRCLGVVGLQRFDQAPDRRVLVTHQVLQVVVPPFCIVVCSIAFVDGRLEHVPRRRRELGQLTAHTVWHRHCQTCT